VTQLGEEPVGGDTDTKLLGRKGRDSGRTPRKPATGLTGLARETLILIVLAIGLAVLFKTFLIQAFYIPSSSMEPTLQISDRVLVEKLSYRFGDIKRGDVIVFIRDEGLEQGRGANPVSRFFNSLGQSIGLVPPAERDFIKRVIGLPGDRIQCSPEGRVVRNGQVIDEPYLPAGTRTDTCKDSVTVPPGQLFVMGDNRGDSLDSRFIGTINQSDVVGRAFVKLWPLGRVGWLHRDR
jgi:signal peptidase I